MNPMQIMNIMKNGGNLESIARQMAKQSNNQIANNLIQQIDNGNQDEVNSIINNVMQQSGAKEQIEQIGSMFGLKK